MDALVPHVCSTVHAALAGAHVEGVPHMTVLLDNANESVTKQSFCHIFISNFDNEIKSNCR